MEELQENGTYSHNTCFTGIFVTYPIVKVMAGNDGFFAYAPHSFFVKWEMQPEMNRFIGPLLYILSAN